FKTGIVPWDAQIMPLVKSVGVFKCPDDSSSAPPGQNIRSYAMNHWQQPCDNCSNNDDNSSPAGQNISLVRSPATTILICEKQDADTNHTSILGSVGNNNEHTEAALYPNNGNNPSGADGNNFNGGVTSIHNGATQLNYAFCDGHVKSLKVMGQSNGNAGANDATRGYNCGGTPTTCTTGIGTITISGGPSDWGLWNILQ
ncbi:MAG: hypothetical protein M3Y56_06660, partial [Armatimonadota bacterium]|nr:hypothetical protein [Armatimonadota bacterium]